MSDSNSINPVGVASAVAVGAAGGAVAPKVYQVGQKYAPVVRAGADRVVLSTKNAATKAGNAVADVATSAGNKVKDASMATFKKTVELADDGAKFARKLIPAKVAKFAGQLVTTSAKILKKPMVAAALIAGLAYSVVSKLGMKG